MEVGISLQTLLGIIFGVGGTGAMTVAVVTYRRLREGKIGDDTALLKRVHGELERQEKRAENAETERDHEAKHKQHWREQAWTYRLQLLAVGIEPSDMELPND